MPRQLKRGELSLKDMSTVREADVAKTQRDARRGILRDYTGRHVVTIAWDLNDDAIRDRIFELSIDGVKVLLDAEQLQRYERWI